MVRTQGYGAYPVHVQRVRCRQTDRLICTEQTQDALIHVAPTSRQFDRTSPPRSSDASRSRPRATLGPTCCTWFGLCTASISPQRLSCRHALCSAPARRSCTQSVSGSTAGAVHLATECAPRVFSWDEVVSPRARTACWNSRRAACTPVDLGTAAPSTREIRAASSLRNPGKHSGCYCVESGDDLVRTIGTHCSSEAVCALSFECRGTKVTLRSIGDLVAAET